MIPGSMLALLITISTLLGVDVIIIAFNLTFSSAISLFSKLVKTKLFLSIILAKLVRTFSSLSFLQLILIVYFSFNDAFTLSIINKEINLNIMFDSKTKSVPSDASTTSPDAHKAPIAATHHKVEAVLSPFILLPSLNITPAPKKPIPDTTCAAILVWSFAFIPNDKYTNKKAPMHTKTLVLRPTIRCLNCLSKPTKILSEKHIINLIIKVVNSIKFSFNVETNYIICYNLCVGCEYIKMKENLFEISKEKIENKINEILDREIEKYEDNSFIKESLMELKRLSSGGKRVRGYLIKLGQMLFGKDDDSYVDIAAAVEIFQTSILIHDDIIDEADKRRGMDTINAKYKGHIGVAKGICIGDLGFFISYRIINNSNISKELKDEIVKIYSKTLHNTVNGEIVDVELPLKSLEYHKNMSDKMIYDIYINKTAWYTIIGPILIGAASAGASEKDKEKLIEMGTNLGIAFQIKDDLLGLYSSVSSMGKTLNDIKEGKQTIIYKYAIDHASKEELDVISKYYGNPNVTEEESNIIINLFDKLGARKNAENLVENYTDNGISIIDAMDVQNKDLFMEFANYLLNRDK